MAPSLKLVLAAALLVSTVSGDFSTSFRTWINAHYGATTLTQLARTDLGAAGSFGGGTHDGSTQTSKKPILIVHGITNTAGTFSAQRSYFVTHGWSDETVYATTYGDAGVTPATQVRMECDYVKQLRTMLQVVNEFTQQKVNIVGYSLGSPIIRKAIKGGLCVDTGYNLGGSLTNIVETYVSVAGANRGSYACLLAYPGINACNSNNGLYCGSQFLRDINPSTGTHYEGNKVFSIWGPNDDKVGTLNLCSVGPNSRIPGQDAEKSNAQGNHDAIIANYVNVTATLFETQSF